MKILLHNRYLLSIIILSLVLKIYISFGTGLPWVSIDSVNYIHQAEALLSGEYENYFPNGYPLIITLVLLFSSVVSFKVLLILLNIFISTLGVFLIYKISENYFAENKLFPLITATIVAFYPNQLNYVRFILSETTCAFLLILSLYFLHGSKYKLSALAAGFASITRTVFLPLGILFSLYLFKRKEYRTGLAYLISFIIPVFAVVSYGYIIDGKISISENSFHNLTLVSTEFKVDYIDEKSSINDYLSYLKNDFAGYLKDRFISLWELWGPFASYSEGLRKDIFFRILIGLRFPLLLFALYGYLKTPEKNEKVFIALAFLLLTIVHFIYFSGPRHSVTVEPLLAILAACGIKEMWYKFFSQGLSKVNH